ncbi:MAG TPA: alpha/beta fold hydrolase [Thermoguttaceae bacterium]|nr:alpha/beta fold hydrolase [Thermoguttaceae bacterium]
MQTRASTSLLVVGAAILLAGGRTALGDDPSVPHYPDHSRVLVYLDADGREHTIDTAADWAIRRRHVLAGMQEAMGPLPDRSNLPPMDVQVTKRMQGEGFERLTISFVTEPNDRLAAHLYLPGGRAPGERVPAMLALHPTSPLGKDRVTEAGGEPNRMVAFELAQRGYVVIAPDYPSFGDSRDYDFQADRYESGTMKGIFNHMRCVDLLQTREEVDPERIGAIGHSLGGHNAMFVGVFDERLKVIVSSCGWTPFHDYYGGKIKGWTSDRYMPKLRDVYGLDPDRVPFDFYEVVAALAPRAFFSNSPLGDGNFDVAGVRKGVAEASQVFALLGAADRLQVRYPDCAHDFPPPVRREAYEFVDRVLRHTPARKVPRPE